MNCIDILKLRSPKIINILQILVLQTMIYFIPVTVTCILMNSNLMDPVL